MEWWVVGWWSGGFWVGGKLGECVWVGKKIE